MSAWLTPEEMVELTERKRWSAQRNALSQMGIPFRPNAAGRPLVERAAVLHYDSKPGRTPAQPNWAALDEIVASGIAKKKR